MRPERSDTPPAIVFYRDPDCVPAGFNLFAVYDVPGAFFCVPTVDGFALHVEPVGVTPPQVSGTIVNWSRLSVEDVKNVKIDID